MGEEKNSLENMTKQMETLLEMLYTIEKTPNLTLPPNIRAMIDELNKNINELRQLQANIIKGKDALSPEFYQVLQGESPTQLTSKEKQLIKNLNKMRDEAEEMKKRYIAAVKEEQVRPPEKKGSEKLKKMRTKRDWKKL